MSFSRPSECTPLHPQGIGLLTSPVLRWNHMILPLLNRFHQGLIKLGIGKSSLWELRPVVNPEMSGQAHIIYVYSSGLCSSLSPHHLPPTTNGCDGFPHRMKPVNQDCLFLQDIYSSSSHSLLGLMKEPLGGILWPVLCRTSD